MGSCIHLHFETTKFCNSMWVQFDPSQKHPRSSLLTSNGAIAPTCYQNNDRLCKCLTSNQVGGCGLANAASHSGSGPGSSPVSLCLLGMQRHSFLSLTQSIEFLCHIFAKLPPSLVHSRQRSARPSSPTTALIAALIQAIFLSFKKSCLGETSAADGSTQGCSPSITPFPLSPASPLPSAASLEIHPESIFAR